MNFVDIELEAQKRIDQLGVSRDKEGVADKRVTMMTAMEIKAQYDQLLNDAFVLIRELAKDLAPIETGTESFHD